MTQRKTLRALFAVLLCGFLMACNNMGLNQADDQAARKAYDQLRSGDYAGLASWSEVEMKNAPASALRQMHDMIPQAAPTEVKVTGWKYNVATGSGNTLETVHQYDYPDRTVMTETVLRRVATGAPWQLAGIHIKAEPKAASSDAEAKTEPSDS